MALTEKIKKPSRHTDVALIIITYWSKGKKYEQALSLILSMLS